MTRTTTLNLIERLSRQEHRLGGQEFLAPLVQGGRARVRLDGLVYEFAIANAQPGWSICRVLDAQRAEPVEEALPWQRGDYLACWPVLRLVLLEPLNDDAWLALPFNPSDAAQRFGMAGPQVVQLVEQGQSFQRVIGRVEGKTIWYDDEDRRADMRIAEQLREALSADQDTPGVPGLGAGEQAAYVLRLNSLRTAHAIAEVESATTTTETRLRHALEIGGARLLGYALTDYGLQVTWERNGQRSVVLLNDDLSVISAGVCLSGQERRFDLASIVGVVEASPDFARYFDEYE